MKLEEGMFIRNHLGRIEKIQTLEPYNDKQCINNHEFSNNVIKASHNIIDLIEVGDIVTTKHLGLEKEYIEVIDNETSLEILKSYFKEKSLELISVVTKQQFESMKYEVK